MRRRFQLGVLVAFLFGIVLAPGHGQTPGKATPKLEAVAETRLLMEALAHANFRGLERHLSPKPADAQAWAFARGQALLIAETANLLMLRPPRNKGDAIWFTRSADLRNQSMQLAQSLGNKDLERSRAGLQEVALSCNRCHQTFRIPIDIVPFQQPEPGPLPRPNPAPKAY